ncbi:MAG TPA: glycoside hydrolase family 2 TIM barrel-domain containing protein [Anaerolineae bacterium]|nr:glycoside hydrolase family 2 TIM barrel-domain containing protein [Anaerolineae bacterium]HOQ97801.1 glycoside hydrolase family 2 TIM barrel-domain containing protein [Anaerolineae bacterium]HPL27114.1 glycoside hydrolase family 2 TIM barrel-domain containing protein [Anaerolineae bacterium]
MDAMPHPEHPRPDLYREPWCSLNGPWEFAADPLDAGLREEWWLRGGLPDEIVVPYPVGAPLSGQQELDAPHAVYWYLRRFDLPGEMHDRCLQLHFGAADYQARVWLNGVLLGDHLGGYTPFSFDVTEIARPSGNRLVVRVADSRSMRQVRGKQAWQRKPGSIFYPGIAGLWQPVWLEMAGPTYLSGLRLSPDLKGGCFHVRATVERPAAAAELRVYLCLSDGYRLPVASLPVADGRVSGPVPIAMPQAWSPESPHLYDLELVLRSLGGTELDRVRTYGGLRDITVDGDQVLLNGRPLYQRLVLVQGYYPGGVYTPKSDAGWQRDVELVRAMGFNGLRLHQKLEAPRFLYWCDRLGVLVWEELPSAYWPGPASRRQIRRMLPEMIARDAGHPSVITWVLFNESWGIHDVNWSAAARHEVFELVNQARNLDPSRPVIDNSGFDHVATDIMDVHHYLASLRQAEELYDRLLAGGEWRHAFLPGLRYLMQPHKAYKPPLAPGARYGGQPIIVSEYGGLGFYHSEGEGSLLDQYRAATQAIASRPQLRGYCYTQMYDVYQEQNGLLTFEREPKVPLEELRAFNETFPRPSSRRATPAPCAPGRAAAGRTPGPGCR